MYKLFQKYFFNFLFLSMPLAYAMENALLSLHQENYQEKNWNEILELLKKGADINTKVDEYGKTLLMLAAEKQKNSEIVFNYLLDNNADVNAKNIVGDTALSIMIKKLNSGKGSLQMCQNLLEHKADPNKKIEVRSTSQTPLFIATQKKNDYTSSLINLLIEHGANFTDVQQFPIGWSRVYNCIPLESAIIHNNTPAIEVLCNAKAPLIDIDEHKNTVFHIITDPTKHQEYNNQKENVIAIIKNAYFDSPKSNNLFKKPNKLLQEKFILIRCLFNRKNLHKDTQSYIFTYLPKFFIFSCLYNRIPKIHKDILWKVHFHLKSLNQILKIKNSQNQTALTLHNSSRGQSQLITSLLSGETLKKDYKIFRQNFPDIITLSDNNLIVDIYNKYALTLPDSTTEKIEKN